ncbi:MAG: single-stranded exonuclease [Francisellaceae bacterium]|nr:single-stranded exonuclease [Francisellaceae bacterium]
MDKILNPHIKLRPKNKAILDQSLEYGLHPILGQILAGRPINTETNIKDAVRPKLKFLSHPTKLADIDKAAKRVAQAIINKEMIGLETDHDCDGQTSLAVLYYNLHHRFGHPKEKIQSFIGHRLEEGYGLSKALLNRILSQTIQPDLLITADNGSSDEAQIAILKQKNIDVIVTDHHEIPKEGIPKSAYACLNPTRKDCNYNDALIAGCMVAWLLMTATRIELINREYLPNTTPSLADSLDFVAVGTIADCVSMARSLNNRAVVNYGIQLIEKELRPCWRALRPVLSSPISSEDLGFKIGPLLNSDGRLSSALKAVNFLLTETDEEAKEWIGILKTQNETRKSIQKKITDKAFLQALDLVNNSKFGLAIYLPEGHAGIHGISASRIKDAFGRPTVILSPKQHSQSVVTGSVRGIDNFHVRDCLQMIDEENPGLFLSFGGHKGAGGLTLLYKDLNLFIEQFDKFTRLQLSSNDLGPVIWTDGILQKKDLTLELLSLIDSLEPYGREFEMPIFEIEAILKEFDLIGDKTHARITFDIEGQLKKGVWFSVQEHLIKQFFGQKDIPVKFAFVPKTNIFKGNRYFDMQVIHIQKIT